MKAIVFDMDGVLFDTESLSNKMWYKIADEMGLGDVSQGAIGAIGRNRTDIIQLFYDLYGKDFPSEEFLERTSKACKDEIQKNGLPVMPGVRGLLDYLKKENYTVGLASSSSRNTILSHLERAGFHDYFEIVIGGDMVKHSKPLPDIYLKACEALSRQPEEVIAVEDSPNGIRSAAAAGMKAVMIPDLVKPDEEIRGLYYRCYDSLKDLQRALEEGDL